MDLINKRGIPLWKIFKYGDKQNIGYLSINDLLFLLDELGIEIGEDKCTILLGLMDFN